MELVLHQENVALDEKDGEGRKVYRNMWSVGFYFLVAFL